MRQEALKVKIRYRKGDTVVALSGKDKGKSGKILKVFPKKATVIVEGVNMVKKHMRKTRQDQQQGGIIHRESPMRISKLAILCKSCSKPARVGVSRLSDGSKSRFCKKCKEMI
jgi:large subunit ribosomal protein L24